MYDPLELARQIARGAESLASLHREVGKTEPAPGREAGCRVSYFGKVACLMPAGGVQNRQKEHGLPYRRRLVENRGAGEAHELRCATLPGARLLRPARQAPPSIPGLEPGILWNLTGRCPRPTNEQMWTALGSSSRSQAGGMLVMEEVAAEDVINDADVVVPAQRQRKRPRQIEKEHSTSTYMGMKGVIVDADHQDIDLEEPVGKQ